MSLVHSPHLEQEAGMLQSVKDSSLAEWYSPPTAFPSTVVSQLHPSMNLEGLTTLNQGHSILGLQRHKWQCIRRSWLRQLALAPAWQFTSLQLGIVPCLQNESDGVCVPDAWHVL